MQVASLEAEGNSSKNKVGVLLCPSCRGECGWESAASSTSYFWKECPDCNGTGNFLAPLSKDSKISPK